MTLQSVTPEPEQSPVALASVPDITSAPEPVVSALALRAPVVDLDPWEYERAHDVGIRRTAVNWNTPDLASYDKARMEDNRTASVAGAIAELAVAKYLGLYWSASVWSRADHDLYKHLPDVGANIEVRRIRTPGNPPVVRSKDLGRGQNLVVAYPVPKEFKQVQILGWIPVEEAWAIGTKFHNADFAKTRCLRVAQMRHISTYPGLATAG